MSTTRPTPPRSRAAGLPSTQQTPRNNPRPAMNGHELNTNSKGAALADRRTPQTETESSVGNSCSSVSIREFQQNCPW